MGNRNPRVTAKGNETRRAAAAAAPSGGKRAVASPADTQTYEKPFRFRFNRVDVDSAWCLTDISKADHAELIRRMAEIEGMRVKEVIGPNLCKREDVAGASPNRAAQRRAQEEFRDDHDRIYSLRVSGEKRIWGLLFDNEFSVIWWDPCHEIWPTKKARGR